MVFKRQGRMWQDDHVHEPGAYIASIGARVLLVDLDVAFGDVAIQLATAP